MPDAVNPVAWYRGATDMFSDKPESGAARQASNREVSGDFPSAKDVPQRPKVMSPDERKDVADGLVADRARAKYTDEKLSREGTPTRPLQPRPDVPKPAEAPKSAPATVEPPRPQALAPAAPAPQPQSQAAAVSQQPPVQSAAFKSPSAASVQPPAAPAAAQQAAPSPRPAIVPAAAPAAAPVAAAVAAPAPVPAAAPPTTVEDAYRRRLAESARQTLSAPTAPAGMIVPASLSVPVPAAGSSLATRVRFGGRGAAPSADDVAALQEVARQQRQRGTTVSVVGYAAGASTQLDPVKRMLEELDLAVLRANAVARELVRLGVPAAVIAVRTADGATASGDTEVSVGG